MIELHLIGYTADLGRLVLDLAGADGGRYRLVVDEDLFATVDELREQRRDAGLPVGDPAEYADELGLAPGPLDPPEEDDAPADEAPASGWEPVEQPARASMPAPVSRSLDGDASPTVRLPGPLWPARPAEDVAEVSATDADGARWADTAGGLVIRLLEERAAADPEPDPEPEPVPQPDPIVPPAVPEPPLEPEPEPVLPPPRPEASLTPAEIQGRLRQGRSVRAVAREAGVEEDWIRRWEAPILAEQARVRDRALSVRMRRPRLGTSWLPLGASVARNLAARGVADDDVSWAVARRRDGRWRVVVRYGSRGHRRAATWTWDPDDHTVTATSDRARELGFTRRSP